MAYEAGRDSFFITCTSNKSLEYYPNNKTSHFTTHLRSPIKLNNSDKRWRVGVSSLTYSQTINNVGEALDMSIVVFDGDREYLVTIPDTFVEDGEELVVLLNGIMENGNIGGEVDTRVNKEGYTVHSTRKVFESDLNVGKRKRVRKQATAALKNSPLTFVRPKRVRRNLEDKIAGSGKTDDSEEDEEDEEDEIVILLLNNAIQIPESTLKLISNRRHIFSVITAVCHNFGAYFQKLLLKAYYMIRILYFEKKVPFPMVLTTISQIYKDMLVLWQHLTGWIKRFKQDNDELYAELITIHTETLPFGNNFFLYVTQDAMFEFICRYFEYTYSKIFIPETQYQSTRSFSRDAFAVRNFFDTIYYSLFNYVKGKKTIGDVAYAVKDVCNAFEMVGRGYFDSVHWKDGKTRIIRFVDGKLDSKDAMYMEEIDNTELSNVYYSQATAYAFELREFFLALDVSYRYYFAEDKVMVTEAELEEFLLLLENALRHKTYIHNMFKNLPPIYLKETLDMFELLKSFIVLDCVVNFASFFSFMQNEENEELFRKVRKKADYVVVDEKQFKKAGTYDSMQRDAFKSSEGVIEGMFGIVDRETTRILRSKKKTDKIVSNVWTVNELQETLDMLERSLERFQKANKMEKVAQAQLMIEEQKQLIEQARKQEEEEKTKESHTPVNVSSETSAAAAAAVQPSKESDGDVETNMSNNKETAGDPSLLQPIITSENADQSSTSVVKDTASEKSIDDEGRSLQRTDAAKLDADFLQYVFTIPNKPPDAKQLKQVEKEKEEEEEEEEEEERETRVLDENVITKSKPLTPTKADEVKEIPVVRGLIRDPYYEYQMILPSTIGRSSNTLLNDLKDYNSMNFKSLEAFKEVGKIRDIDIVPHVTIGRRDGNVKKESSGLLGGFKIKFSFDKIRDRINIYFDDHYYDIGFSPRLASLLGVKHNGSFTIRRMRERRKLLKCLGWNTKEDIHKNAMLLRAVIKKYNGVATFFSSSNKAVRVDIYKQFNIIPARFKERFETFVREETGFSTVNDYLRHELSVSHLTHLITNIFYSSDITYLDFVIFRLYHEFILEKRIKGDERIDLNTTEKVFIYTNIVEQEYIDSDLLRLLEVFPTRRKDESPLTQIEYSNMHYKTVALEEIQDIEFLIAGSYGKPVPFRYGPVTIQLHFKRF